MRRFVLTLLFVVLIVSLNRDETVLPHLPNEPLTKAEVEEIIDRYLNARSTWIRCDCHAPTVECEEVCAQSDQVGRICGTMVLQAEMEIRRAMEVGSNPWAIAQLIAEHPDPFSKKYFLVYPDKKSDEKLQPISLLAPIDVFER